MSVVQDVSETSHSEYIGLKGYETIQVRENDFLNISFCITGSAVMLFSPANPGQSLTVCFDISQPGDNSVQVSKQDSQ